MNKEITKIVTHDGPFHADDIVACALLYRFSFDAHPILTSIERTRDRQVLETAKKDSQTLVLDVGGEFAPEKLAFDHHFTGSPVRADGIPYASAGLVLHHMIRAEENESERFESAALDEFIRRVDASDNGVKIPNWTFSETIHKCNPVNDSSPEEFLRRFMLLRSMVGVMLENLVIEGTGVGKAVQAFERIPQIKAWVKEHDEALAASASRIREAFNQEGELLVLDRYEPALAEIASEAPEKKLFSVFPAHDGKYMVQQIPLKPKSFVGRKQLPENWAGLRDTDLDAVTGVEGGVFCHPARFIAGHSTQEGAIRLALLAASA